MPKVIDLPTATTMANADYFVMESSGGGTKKITKSNAVGKDSFVANYYKANPSSSLTITNAAEQTVYAMSSRTFYAGTYLVMFRVTPATISFAGDNGQGFLNIGATRVATFSPISHAGGGETGLAGDIEMVFRFTLSANTTGSMSVSMISASSQKTFTIPAYADCYIMGWQV